jgi:hypothetical protein
MRRAAWWLQRRLSRRPRLVYRHHITVVPSAEGFARRLRGDP